MLKKEILFSDNTSLYPQWARAEYRLFGILIYVKKITVKSKEEWEAFKGTPGALINQL